MKRTTYQGTRNHDNLHRLLIKALPYTALIGKYKENLGKYKNNLRKYKENMGRCRKQLEKYREHLGKYKEKPPSVFIGYDFPKNSRPGLQSYVLGTKELVSS